MCVGDCFTFVGLNLLHFVFLLDVVVRLRLPRNDLPCFALCALHASRCVALRVSWLLRRNQPATAMAAIKDMARYILYM